MNVQKASQNERKTAINRGNGNKTMRFNSSVKNSITSSGIKRRASLGLDSSTPQGPEKSKTLDAHGFSTSVRNKRGSFTRSRSRSRSADSDTASDLIKGHVTTASKRSNPGSSGQPSSKPAFGSKPPTSASGVERRRALGKETQQFQRLSFSELKAKYAALDGEVLVLQNVIEEANKAQQKAEDDLKTFRQEAQEKEESHCSKITALQAELKEMKDLAQSNQLQLEEQHHLGHQALQQDLRQKQQECRRLAKCLETKGIDSVSLAEFQFDENKVMKMGADLDARVQELSSGCDAVLAQLDNDSDAIAALISDLRSISIPSF